MLLLLSSFIAVVCLEIASGSFVFPIWSCVSLETKSWFGKFCWGNNARGAFSPSLRLVVSIATVVLETLIDCSREGKRGGTRDNKSFVSAEMDWNAGWLDVFIICDLLNEARLALCMSALCPTIAVNVAAAVATPTPAPRLGVAEPCWIWEPSPCEAFSWVPLSASRFWILK